MKNNLCRLKEIILALMILSQAPAVLALDRENLIKSANQFSQGNSEIELMTTPLPSNKRALIGKNEINDTTQKEAVNRLLKIQIAMEPYKIVENNHDDQKSFTQSVKKLLTSFPLKSLDNEPLAREVNTAIKPAQ